MGAPHDGIGAAILERLGIEPIIQAGGPNTKHSGSSPRPESWAAMEFASQHFFQMDELLIAAGKDVAHMIGVPAATVTAGAGAGLVVQAAAAVARDDLERIARLPDTEGMPNELIFQRGAPLQLRATLPSPGNQVRGSGRRRPLYGRRSREGDHRPDCRHNPPGICVSPWRPGASP